MPSDVVEQLVFGVASSVITGVAVWSAGRLRATGRARSRRRFLGLVGPWRQACLLVVGRKPSASDSIHHADVGAMLEIAALVRAVGVEPRPVSPREAAESDGQVVEFCISGRDANPRTEAHLRRHVPGLTFHPFRPGSATSLAFQVGDQLFVREDGVNEFVALARVCRPGRPHLFLVSGQTGVTNRAGARFLVEQLRHLSRRYGPDRSFCLVLRVVEPAILGSGAVEEVAEVPVDGVRPGPG